MNDPRRQQNKINGYVPLMSHIIDRPTSSREKREAGYARPRTMEERIQQVTEAFGRKHNRPLYKGEED